MNKDNNNNNNNKERKRNLDKDKDKDKDKDNDSKPKRQKNGIVEQHPPNTYETELTANIIESLSNLTGRHKDVIAHLQAVIAHLQAEIAHLQGENVNLQGENVNLHAQKKLQNDLIANQGKHIKSLQYKVEKIKKCLDNDEPHPGK